MEDRRCSLSLSVFFLAVLLDSGTAGESLSASKLCPSVCFKRVGRLLRRWNARAKTSRTSRRAAQRRATGDSCDVSSPV